jgi:hypothetical protein
VVFWFAINERTGILPLELLQLLLGGGDLGQRTLDEKTPRFFSTLNELDKTGLVWPCPTPSG